MSTVLATKQTSSLDDFHTKILLCSKPKPAQSGGRQDYTRSDKITWLVSLCDSSWLACDKWVTRIESKVSFLWNEKSWIWLLSKKTRRDVSSSCWADVFLTEIRTAIQPEGECYGYWRAFSPIIPMQAPWSSEWKSLAILAPRAPQEQATKIGWN